ncbi:FIG00954142: hypothetical protein, partial [Pseudomonas fluorescens]
GSSTVRRMDDDRSGQHPDHFHGFHRLGSGEEVQGRALWLVHSVFRAGPGRGRVHHQECGDRPDRIRRPI